jgi:hypothetical protein
MRLSEEERRRIALHRKVAPPIPERRQVKSLKGQLAFDFEGKGWQARDWCRKANKSGPEN